MGIDSYKEATQRSLVVMVQMSILIVVMVVMQGYTCDKTAYSYTHAHTQMSACIIGEIRINPMDCTNVIFFAFDVVL